MKLSCNQNISLMRKYCLKVITTNNKCSSPLFPTRAAAGERGAVRGVADQGQAGGPRREARHHEERERGPLEGGEGKDT